MLPRVHLALAGFVILVISIENKVVKVTYIIFLNSTAWTAIVKNLIEKLKHVLYIKKKKLNSKISLLDAFLAKLDPNVHESYYHHI
jgi:hypothetical protein